MAQNSATAELILQVQSRIGEEVTDIKHIEEYLEQLSEIAPNGKPPVKWPFCGIDVEILDADDQGAGEQEMAAEVVLILALPPYSSGASWFPENKKLQSLKIHDLVHQLYVALHNWEPEKFGALSFRSTKRVSVDGVLLRAKEIRFTTCWVDDSAGTSYNMTDVGPLDSDSDIGVGEDPEE